MLVVHILAAIGITVLSVYVVPIFADVSAVSDNGQQTHPLTARLMEWHPHVFLMAGGALTGLAVVKALLARSRGLGMLFNIVFVVLFGAWLVVLVAGLYLPILEGINSAVSVAS
jgi:type II secretory pathway component PulF